MKTNSIDMLKIIHRYKLVLLFYFLFYTSCFYNTYSPEWQGLTASNSYTASLYLIAYYAIFGVLCYAWRKSRFISVY